MKQANAGKLESERSRSFLTERSSKHDRYGQRI